MNCANRFCISRLRYRFRAMLLFVRRIDVMPKHIVTAFVATALFMCAASAQDRSQSRSMVMAQTGIVASESVLASQVGARILEGGGNAIDAAIATNAVMGLVAPMNDGVGGDLFAMVYEART